MVDSTYAPFLVRCALRSFRRHVLQQTEGDASVNQQPNNMPIVRRTGNRWSIIPALTLAGLLSAIWTDVFIWFPSIVSVQSYILFVLLASVSLGLSLGAVLWLYGLIRTWKGLTAAVGVMIAAHFFGEFGARHLPIGLREYMDVPLLGSIIPELALTASAVAFIIILTFLMLTRPKRKVALLVLISFGCSVFAGIIVAVIDGTQRGAWFSLLKGTVLGLSWQLVLASSLATSLLLGQIDSNVSKGADDAPRASFTRRFAAFGVLLMFLVATGVWCHSTQVRYGKKNLELQARVKAEIAKSLAEAPTFENLSAPVPKPLDKVLLLQEINGWKPYLSGSQDYGAQRNGGDMLAPFPARRTYYARYATPGDNMAVVANVTEYPNAEWAKYAVRNTPMPHEFINHPESVKHLVRLGNNLYQDAAYFFWPSGEELIFLECSGVLPDVIDGFLKAYLVKYPSSL